MAQWKDWSSFPTCRSVLTWRVRSQSTGNCPGQAARKVGNDMRTWALYFLALMSVALSASCQGGYHTENETYYLVGMNLESPYWEEVVYGFEGGVRRLGLDVKGEVVGPPDPDVEAQLQAFRETVAKKPAGILVSPARAEPFTEAINQAIEQGIPVICIDSDAPESRRVMFIGTRNYQVGLEGGRLTAQLLEEKGDVAILTIPGQYNLDERVRGYRDVFKDYPDIRVVKVLNGEGNVKKAEERISKLLDEGPSIDAIVCVDNEGGEGAANALYRRALSKKIHIVAMDKSPGTLEWIERGGIAATISQKPYTMAFYGVKFLDDLHHNRVHQFMDWRTAPVYPLPTLVDTGTAVVQRENVEAFKASLPPPPVAR